MMLVPCPHCGPRNSTDLHYVGESHPRPSVNDVTAEEWRTYLYMRDNPAGLLTETWYCRSGCRQYFTAVRNTATNEFVNHPLPGNRAGAVDPSFHYVSESKTGSVQPTIEGAPS